MSRETTGSDFWSRRRAAVREEEAREEVERQAAVEASKSAELAEKSDEDILEELGLPDPDDLQEGDDFKAFLSAVVPDRLRRRALRRLWMINPTLANLDGLIEYGEDFTDAATVVENLQTTYQVGKGMLKHLVSLSEDSENEGMESEVAVQGNADGPTDPQEDSSEATNEDGSDFDPGCNIEATGSPANSDAVRTEADAGKLNISDGEVLTTAPEMAQDALLEETAATDPVTQPVTREEPVAPIGRKMRFNFA